MPETTTVENAEAFTDFGAMFVTPAGGRKAFEVTIDPSLQWYPFKFGSDQSNPVKFYVWADTEHQAKQAVRDKIVASCEKLTQGDLMILARETMQAKVQS